MSLSPIKLAPLETAKAVRVRLARGMAGLAKRRKLPARVRVSSSDAAGNLATDSVDVGLRIPRR